MGRIRRQRLGRGVYCRGWHTTSSVIRCVRASSGRGTFSGQALDVTRRWKPIRFATVIDDDVFRTNARGIGDKQFVADARRHAWRPHARGR